MDNVLSGLVGAALCFLFTVITTSTKIDVEAVRAATAYCDTNEGADLLWWKPSGGISSVKCKNGAVFTIQDGKK